MGQIFQDAVAKKGDELHMLVERPVPMADGRKAPPALEYPQEWTKWTYKQSYDDSVAIGKAFLKLGAVQHDTINIFGFNCPEWHISCLGAMCGGFKAAGIYPTDTTEQVGFKSQHSHASIAVVEDTGKNLKKFTSNLDMLKHLKAIICWDQDYKDDLPPFERTDGSKVPVISFRKAIGLGMEVSDAEWKAHLDKVSPAHCCALIYTSGTTGNPKAVMITHDNLVFEGTSVMEAQRGVLCSEKKAERILSYLPLTHVAGMLVDIVVPVVASAFTVSWFEVGFARPYDLKIGSLKDRLCAVRPTFFLGVPRVWEKVSEGLKAMGAKTKGTKKKIVTWAKAKSLEYQMNCQMGGTGIKPSGLGTAGILTGKIKGALGLDEMKFGATGAAPITTDTLEYFGALNIQINELYGMSECCGTTTWSSDMSHIWGSCGYALPGTEVKAWICDPDDFNKKVEAPKAKDINNATEAEQGELCYRGRHIMMGYMANPALGEEHVAMIQKKNIEAIDDDGWLHSGDKGCIGENGMLKITGRYKELIIGAGGENISPVPIEDTMKSEGTALSNVMMVGDKRKFNIVLVTLKAQGATGEAAGNDNLDGDARKVDPAVTTISGAMKSEVWAKYITDVIVRTNKTVPNNPSKIQRFTILPHDFSVDTGELTATLKLKRSVVEKKHTPMIDKVYAVNDMKATYVQYEEALFPPRADANKEE
jgi:long-chain-fatty-acid--CoA ligase ACSBG